MAELPSLAGGRNVSVANRYLGAFRGGAQELRGIDLRRPIPRRWWPRPSSGCGVLAEADGFAGSAARIRGSWRCRWSTPSGSARGRCAWRRLTIKRTASKEAGEHKTNSQVGRRAARWPPAVRPSIRGSGCTTW